MRGQSGPCTRWQWRRRLISGPAFETTEGVAALAAAARGAVGLFGNAGGEARSWCPAGAEALRLLSFGGRPGPLMAVAVAFAAPSPPPPPRDDEGRRAEPFLAGPLKAAGGLKIGCFSFSSLAMRSVSLLINALATDEWWRLISDKALRAIT